jgi:hypothetical protein
MPTAQVSLFVGISIIYLRMALTKPPAKCRQWRWQVMVVMFFHFFRVVCGGKGFEDEFSDNSDLSFSVKRVFELSR